jgi:hypothetical protein
MNSNVSEWYEFPAPLMASVVLLLHDTTIIWYGNRVRHMLFFSLLLTCLKTVFIDRCLSFFFWSKYFLLLIIHLVSSNVYVFVCLVTQSDNQ